MKTTQRDCQIRRYSMLCILLFLISAVSARATSAVVQNGGFETGSFASWTLSGNINNAGVETSFVHSGSYAGQFGEVSSLGYFSQTLTTVPGQVYRLSFWLYSPGGSTSVIYVSADANVLMDVTNPPPSGWSNYVFTVTATGSSLNLEFGFRNDPSWFYLDDICVTPIDVGLTFDDLVNVLPNGYGGLNWNNFVPLDGVHYADPSGYKAGVVSTNNVIYNGGGFAANMNSTNAFNLYSAYVTAAWYDNLQLEVKGYAGGILIYDNTYTLSATSPTLINFNYLGVTEVDFVSFGGTQHVGYTWSGTQFVMDNVNVTTGPGVQSNPQLVAPLPGPLMGPSAYVRSLSAGEPWGVPDNIIAMNRVFGSNNWDSLYYETVNPAALFSRARHSVFLEGSDANATALASFLSVNLSAMQSWVSNGGSLFINAAPNEGGNINFGFGVTLSYTNGVTVDTTAIAVKPLNPIFNGPFSPAGTNWNGGYFAHAIILGSGPIPLIVNSNNTANVILGEEQLGLGHALFGGMTMPSFHSPQPQGTNLLANILAYMDNCPQITFDDLTSTTGGIAVPNGYRGLNWSNFYELDGVHYPNSCGYQAGTISSNNIGYNGYGNPARITSAIPFNFVSAWLTAAWNDNLQVEVKGYAHGLLAYDQTYTLSATAPTLIVFDYLGVTEVDFNSSGGTPHLAYGPTSATHFAMDNVTVAFTPGPELAIAPGAGGTDVVSWSSPATGWSLQQAPSLVNGTWTSPLEVVNDGGTNKFIVVNPATSNRFYRLIFQ